MRIGVVIPSFDQYGNGSAFRQLVEAIEELGFDSAWFGDHIVVPGNTPTYLGTDWLEPVACMIQGLAMTSRISFGADVLVAPYRDPILLAKMAATATALSGPRMILGMGIGWLYGEFEALGIPFADRVAMTEEYLQVVRLLFQTKGPVSFRGKWTSFRDIYFEPKGAAPPPPLLVGGNHPKVIRRAAFLGDGWHPLFMSEAAYAHGKAYIEKIRTEAGITRPFNWSYSAPQTRIVSAGTKVRTVVAKVDPSQGINYAPTIPTDANGRQRFIGTAAELREDFTAFAKAGAEQMVIRFAVPNDSEIGLTQHLDQLRIFAAEVLPHCVKL